jgi:hypothetical protein
VNRGVADGTTQPVGHAILQVFGLLLATPVQVEELDPHDDDQRSPRWTTVQPARSKAARVVTSIALGASPSPHTPTALSRGIQQGGDEPV